MIQYKYVQKKTDQIVCLNFLDNIYLYLSICLVQDLPYLMCYLLDLTICPTNHISFVYQTKLIYSFSLQYTLA